MREVDLNPQEWLSAMQSKVRDAMRQADWSAYTLAEPVLKDGPWIGDTSSISGHLKTIRLVYGDWDREEAPRAAVVTTTRPRLALREELLATP